MGLDKHFYLDKESKKYYDFLFLGKDKNFSQFVKEALKTAYEIESNEDYLKQRLLEYTEKFQELEEEMTEIKDKLKIIQDAEIIEKEGTEMGIIEKECKNIEIEKNMTTHAEIRKYAQEFQIPIIFANSPITKEFMILNKLNSNFSVKDFMSLIKSYITPEKIKEAKKEVENRPKGENELIYIKNLIEWINQIKISQLNASCSSQ